MILDAKPQLRSALLSLKLQPTHLTSHHHCAGAAQGCLAIQRSHHTSRRPNNDSSLHKAPTSSQILREKTSTRHASSRSMDPPPRVEHAANPDPSLSYAAPMTSPQDPNAPFITPTPRLTWNDYLNLRKTRRRYNLVASLCTSLVTTSAGISVLARQDIDQAAVFGLDPFLVMGAATLSSGAIGWLMGPFLGEKLWGWKFSGLRREIGIKEKDLYRRIKQHRVDPSSSSAGNPVPDYYGEKIGSVAEYRTWLKDQNAYRKKRENFFR